MSCTTILVGKKASYDGSTIIARDDDSGSGRYDPKKFVVVAPQEQPRHYRSVLSHVEIDLPDNPCRYSIVPNVLPNRGILAEAGVNERNVAMSATETIAVNERVLGADPLVALQPADEANGKPETPGGIGEEDIITLVLPYVNTAREGVKRLAELLETYGTYESNGIIISDVDEIWYVETIGGHHWIARRVPDDKCAIIPNQLGIDYFDFDDAFSDAREFMCSADLQEFIETHHLGRAAGTQGGMNGGHCNPRIVFGTATAKDHIYNTPRAWYMYRYLDPADAENLTPESDDIPWCLEPENAVTVEDVDFLLGSHFEGTPYDPYGTQGTEESRHQPPPAAAQTRKCSASAAGRCATAVQHLPRQDRQSAGSAPLRCRAPGRRYFSYPRREPAAAGCLLAPAAAAARPGRSPGRGAAFHRLSAPVNHQIGRASCRERVYVLV